jgi:hypothetical protein
LSWSCSEILRFARLLVMLGLYSGFLLRKGLFLSLLARVFTSFLVGKLDVTEHSGEGGVVLELGGGGGGVLDLGIISEVFAGNWWINFWFGMIFRFGRADFLYISTYGEKKWRLTTSYW